MHFFILEQPVSSQIQQEWNAACGENKPLILNEDRGSITSPNYPYSYFNNLECQWLIPRVSGKFTNVSVHDVELQYGYEHKNILQLIASFIFYVRIMILATNLFFP